MSYVNDAYIKPKETGYNNILYNTVHLNDKTAKFTKWIYDDFTSLSFLFLLQLHFLSPGIPLAHSYNPMCIQGCVQHAQNAKSKVPISILLTINVCLQECVVCM